MKIFAIRVETDQQHKDLAYLVYYEKAKQFYIELPENADPWETPLLLSSLAKRGKNSQLLLERPLGTASDYTVRPSESGADFAG